MSIEIKEFVGHAPKQTSKNSVTKEVKTIKDKKTTKAKNTK